MYIKLISTIIQEKLKSKERALSHRARSFGESGEDALKPKDIQSRSTFVRMCSNKSNVPNIVISGGELDFEGDMKFGLQQFTGQGSYTDEQDLTGKNYGTRPISGIKNIEVAYKGSWKAIREATVTWVVGGIPDLERLTPYFLTVGKTVALDWGWVNPNVKTYAEMFNNETPFIYFKDGDFRVDPDIFNNPQFKIQNSGGDYDALAGKISNFETTLREDGGFDCITKITAIGSALFQKPIDKPANQIEYVTPESSNDDGEETEKKLAHDSDNIINALINLKGIILSDIFKVEKNSSSAYKKLRDIKIKGLDGHLHFGDNYGFAVDSVNNPNVIWMNRSTNLNSFGYWTGELEEIFVKWGWFEDWILNRYVSVKGGKDNEIKMTVRSIDTVLDVNNLPIELTDDKANELGRGDDTISYTGGLYEDVVTGEVGTNTYKVKSGDTLSEIAREVGADINILVSVNLETLLPDVLSGTNQADTNADNLFRPFPEDVVDEADLDGTVYEYPSPEYGGGTYIPRSEYGYLNLQPGQVLIYTPWEAARKNDTETLNKNDKNNTVVAERNKVEFIDEMTSFRGLQNLNNRGNYLKTPTLIKNVKKFLKPRDPLKFFSTELLPTYKETYHTAKERDPKHFKAFWDALRSLDNSKFTKPGKEDLGRLRYMWVNIKEIQAAFGITFDSKNSKKPITISPPGTLENGIKALLTRLNRNFYDFWDFELTVDTYDSTNIKVIDKKAVDITGDSIAYTKWKTNSHKVSKAGIYKFPSFKIGSIVKNQSLSFKIPDSMAITIMYGSNKKDKKNESEGNEHNNPQIMKMFNSDGSSEYEDNYLKGIKSSNISNSSKVSFVNVGSENVNHNSKIVEDQGLTIQPKDWWNKWTGDNEVEPPDIDKDGYAKARTKFEIVNDNLVYMYEDSERNEDVELEDDMDFQDTQRIWRRAKDAKWNIVTDANKMPNLYKFTKDNFYQIKGNVEKLLRNRLHGGVRIGTEDSIKVDTIIPAELSLEIDGIGGLVPGDICQTEYIQPKYNVNFYKDDVPYGPFTYFQIVGISQKVDSAGWFTELTTKMRINHIPDIQDLQIEDAEVERIDEDPLPDVPRPSIPVPTDDEDIADDVTLDDLDFDDFENWDAPGKTVIATKGQTFGKGSTGTLEEFIATENLRKNTSNQILLPKMSKIDGVSYGRNFIQEGSTYSNLQLGDQGFKLNIEAYEKGPVRPSIPVPTDDEDIADDVTLDDLDFDDFAEWLSPALGFIKRTTTSELIAEVEKKDETTKKSHKGRKRISTFPGWFARDGYLYDKYIYASRHHANWRPSYKYPDGSRSWKSHKIINNITYDFFMGDSNSDEFETVVVEIKEMRDEDEIQSYWDGYIEEPSNSGNTALREDGSSPTKEHFTPGLMIGGN